MKLLCKQASLGTLGYGTTIEESVLKKSFYSAIQKIRRRMNVIFQPNRHVSLRCSAYVGKYFEIYYS